MVVQFLSLFLVGDSSKLNNFKFEQFKNELFSTLNNLKPEQNFNLNKEVSFELGTGPRGLNIA
jgi:hypothetical protein